MYARTSFRGAKTCKIGKKGCAFGHIDKFWEGHEGQIKKNACKNAYLGSIFIPEKCVFRMCFESPFTRMISSLKYKCTPLASSQLADCLPLLPSDIPGMIVFLNASCVRWCDQNRTVSCKIYL